MKAKFYYTKMFYARYLMGFIFLMVLEILIILSKSSAYQKLIGFLFILLLLIACFYSFRVVLSKPISIEVDDQTIKFNFKNGTIDEINFSEIEYVLEVHERWKTTLKGIRIRTTRGKEHIVYNKITQFEYFKKILEKRTKK